MKNVVINTQYMENYGDRNDPYMKFKGGNTYVVNGLNSKQVNKIVDGGIPTLSKLIEDKNDYYEEYILGWEIVGDDETPWDEWETPIEFSWGGDRWLAGRQIANDEYGYMRAGIEAKREEWIPLEGGERAHYKAEYLTLNGWFSEKEAMAQLEAA